MTMNRLNAAIGIIDLAASRAHMGAMASSAQLCLDDARRLLDVGDLRNAVGRAATSLAYSVGRFSSDYADAARLAKTI